jgi:hypothetical protein
VDRRQRQMCIRDSPKTPWRFEFNNSYAVFITTFDT